MSLFQTTPSDEEIIATAIIVDDQDTKASPELRAAARVLRELRSGGQGPLVVRWPNGIEAVLDSDPSYGKAWNELLVATYRRGLEDKLGLVLPGAV